MTTRPLAAFTDPAAAPAKNRKTPSPTGPGASAASTRNADDKATPTVITNRSPVRSAAAPHAISVSNRPAIGAETIRLAPSRLRSSWARSAGISIGIPYTDADVAAWANVPTARIVHRRRSATRESLPGTPDQ